MVIRSSFVTNSSSSSFVCIDVDSKEIHDILQEFEDEISEIFECGHMELIDDTKVTMYLDEAWVEDPNEPKDILTAIASLFDYNFAEEAGYAEEDEEELDMTQFSEITQRLFACKDEILANLRSFRLVNGNSGWQGDDESRYDEGWYEEDTLEEVKAAIAVENNVEVDEITPEMFCDYVGDKISIEESVFEYDSETKEIKHSRTTELEG